MAEVIRHTENLRNYVSGDRHSESVCNSLFALTNLQKLRYFPNNQLVNFHRTHVIYISDHSSADAAAS